MFLLANLGLAVGYVTIELRLGRNQTPCTTLPNFTRFGRFYLLLTHDYYIYRWSRQRESR